ncbi:hypothetical protein ACPUVO_02725 [Pseudocolwellia sp. HL-MZ19]|uniref:hypothetical protein n=1 Tax=Pseudocolwellia sp. HL-MZ19 TaxID=3400846 RepID=UPI003CFB3B9D
MNKLKKKAERLLNVEKQNQGQQSSKHLIEIDSLKQSIDKHRSELEALVSSNEKNQTTGEKLNKTIADLEKDKASQLQTDKEKDKSHQTTLSELNKTLTQEKAKIKAYEDQLNTQKITLEEQVKTHKTLIEQSKKTDENSSKKITELGNKITTLEKDIAGLTTKNKDLTKHYEEANTMIDDYQKEIIHLKESYDNANSNVIEIQKRVEANKEKQESEYDKARDTIKYLRDENLDLHTKLDQQVTELEDKLREYRLRFEYAQKQLNSK